MNDQSVQVRQLGISELERMANAISKSGMFAVKTPEGALTLLLIAQAEGIPPAQAMMDYDLIQNKPALKSAAMLARFQRSGGKVKWLQASDNCVEATFTHPACDGHVTVKWDNDRIKSAGLSDRDMHKKFGQQMKRARCITEGIRACAPQCIPLGMYSVEETGDMEPEVNITPAATVAARDQAQTEVVRNVSTALTEAEIDEHILAMDVQTLPELLRAFEAAWNHAKHANDKRSADRFKAVYDLARADIDKRAPKDGLI